MSYLKFIPKRFYFFSALKDEEMVRSPVTLDEATDDVKTSTEVELYEKDDDVDELDEEAMLEEEKSLSGK